MLFHLTTSVPPWNSPFLDGLDACLAQHGSTPILLPWGYPLEGDGEHFTEQGFSKFSYDFAKELGERIRGPVLILSDSTIGYGGEQWVHDVERSLAHRGIHARVDAVNGSGFVARARFGEHFYARLRNRREDHVVFIGGWNDEHSGHSAHRACSSAIAALRRAS